MLSAEDRYLLQKLKEGDVHALESIFNKYYGNLCRYLILIFKNQLLVEHIVQDIFIYLWENRKSIRIHTSIEAYLYTSGRYKALNQLRNSRRQEKIRKDMSELKSITANATETLVEISELQMIIDEAVDSLPARCQEIFRLSREEEMSYKEIAGLLNISLNTVERQMSIALKKLRTILKPFFL